MVGTPRLKIAALMLEKGKGAFFYDDFSWVRRIALLGVVIMAIADADEDEVTRTGLTLVADGYGTLAYYARYGLTRGARQLTDEKKARHDQPIVIDIKLEEDAFEYLGRKSPFGKWIRSSYGIEPLNWIFGEETLNDPRIPVELDDIVHPVALVDMLDGSKLWTLELSNWCVAALLYIPSDGRILGSFISDALGRIYFATAFREGAYRIGVDLISEPLFDWVKTATPIDPLINRTEDRQNPTLREAYICWVGQRLSRFEQFAKCAGLLGSLDGDLARLFNLGGNPMLLRVADGGMDVVLELVGQKPHDAIPGIYIALKAGAVAFNLDDGNEIGIGSDLIKSALKRPKDRGIRYIVAAQKELGLEVREKITSDLRRLEQTRRLLQMPL